MKKTLLIIVGCVNVVFVLFHIYLGFRFHSLQSPLHGLLETFNACGTLIIVFLAYAFLARGKDVLQTGLGRAVIVLGASIYLSRLIAEFVLLQGNLMIAGVCVATGLLHLALLGYVRVRPSAL